MWGGFENSAKHVVRAFGGLLAFEGNSFFLRVFIRSGACDGDGRFCDER